MSSALTISERRLSTRLIRKGALIEETYRVFRAWNLKQSVRQNLLRIRETNTIGADNQSWLREVTATLSSRFQSEAEVRPLVVLAQKDLPLQEWKAFLLWHVGATDALYWHFGAEWLFDAYAKGLHNLRSEPVVPFLRKTVHALGSADRNLSDYGLLRGARDLLRMAGAFGLLQGKAVKNFTSYQIPESAFIYVLHALTESEANCRKMIERPEWRLFLLTPEQVEKELLNLHQFRKLEYHTAGSLAQLKLPCASALEYVERLTP
jgi:hypothetical protein